MPRRSCSRRGPSGQFVERERFVEALLDGKPASAMELARAGIQAGQLSPADLRRDPNLSLLADARQVQEIST